MAELKARVTSARPTAKVTSSAIAGALSTLILAAFAHWQKEPLPPGIGEAIVTVISFLAAYLTHPKAGEVEVYVPR